MGFINREELNLPNMIQICIFGGILAACILSYCQIEQQGEFNRRSLRPHVGVMDIRSERKEDGNLAIALIFNNVGRTPANDLDIQVLQEIPESTKVILRGQEIDVSKTRLTMSPFPNSLFPQQWFVRNITYGGNNMSGIYSGEQKLSLSIDVRYRGLVDIPKEDYHGYYVKVQYNPKNDDWDVQESNAW